MTTDKGLDHKNVYHPYCPSDVCACVCLSAHSAFQLLAKYPQLITYFVSVCVCVCG